jgi:hypothetical protein
MVMGVILSRWIPVAVVSSRARRESGCERWGMWLEMGSGEVKESSPMYWDSAEWELLRCDAGLTSAARIGCGREWVG